VKWSFLVLPSFPSGSQHKAKPHFSSTQASHHPPAKISQLCQLYTCTVASFSPLGPFASLHLDFYHFFKVMKLLWTCHFLFADGHTGRQGKAQLPHGPYPVWDYVEDYFTKFVSLRAYSTLPGVRSILQMRKVEQFLGNGRAGTQDSFPAMPTLTV
jgi:hypothetical protein